MLEKFSSKIIAFAILPIAVFSVQRYSSFPIGNTFIWWAINLTLLFGFFWQVRYTKIEDEDRRATNLLKWFLVWNAINIFRGIFVAELYWDYKGLTDMGMALLLPMVAFLALDKEKIQLILTFFIKYALPVGLLLLPFLSIGSWGWYLFPISLLMLFLPALPIRGKIIVLIVTIIVALGELSTRSNVIKYGLPIVFLLLFYTSRSFVVSGKIMAFAHKLLLIIPIVFFVLAITGTFEIFKINEYIEGNYVETRKNSAGEVVEEDLTTDTRTFLYVEVLNSAIKNNYWLIGRSPARGNETVHFAFMGRDTTGRPERLRNEVGILNTFTWTGIVGVILFFLVFAKASFLAVSKSNNIYIKMVGLFIAFRWAYSWVEDYQGFDLNNFVIWLMVGMCFSSSFRKMTDLEFKIWAWGIFERKHYLKYQYYRENGLIEPTTY